MADSETGFDVFGRNSSDAVHYVGAAKTFDEAARLRAAMEYSGWRHVAVFDLAGQEVMPRNP
jgi:hypothetical protein